MRVKIFEIKNLKKKNRHKTIKENHQKIKKYHLKGSMIFEYPKTWKIKNFWVNSGGGGEGGEGGEGGGGGGEESDL